MTDTPDSAASPDIASLSFEAAMGELETIVRRLESGDVSIEDSVALYERGQALRGHSEARRDAAQPRSEETGRAPSRAREWLAVVAPVAAITSKKKTTNNTNDR